MTTIVIRDGVVAVDSQETIEGERGDYIRRCQKLFQTHLGIWVALAGDTGGLAFLRMCEEIDPGRKAELRDAIMAGDSDFTAVAMHASGAVLEWDRWLSPCEITAPFYACGTGAKAALGALEMGATAEEACRIACKIDPYSSEPITVQRFKK